MVRYGQGGLPYCASCVRTIRIGLAHKKEARCPSRSVCLSVCLLLVAFGCTNEISLPNEPNASLVDSLPLLRTESAARLSPEQAARFARVVAQMHNVDVQLAELDDSAAARLLGDGEITLALGPNLSSTFSRVQATVRSNGRISWRGRGNGSGEQLLLVLGTAGLYASITSEKHSYKVEPIGDGFHAVSRLDYVALPTDEPNPIGVLNPDSVGPTGAESPPTGLRQGLRLAEPANTSETNTLPREIGRLLLAPRAASLGSGDTVTVVVGYTANAAAATLDMGSLIQLAVDESNAGYSNSGVPLFVDLVHFGEVSYNESLYSFPQHLSALQSSSDGVMEVVHTWRNQYLGDFAVLLVDDNDYCGLASQILATHTSAFAVVHYDCATGYYTFAHELGHLQGARHQTSIDNSSTPFAYGHGFVAPGKSFRTIMAVDGLAPRVNFWSNNDATDPVQGSSQYEDNARVLSETRSAMAAFRRHISVTIEGPTSVRSSEFCTWTAVIGGNVSAASYEWAGVTSGSSSSVTDALSQSGSLSVTVYDAYGRGNVHEINVAIDDFGPSCGA